MGNVFEQAALPIENPAVYEPVETAIKETFSSPSVGRFLQAVARSKMRVRDFEKLRDAGVLGETVRSGYAQLGASDQGHIRELYLHSVEQVAPELRGKYLKVYAYY